ncbi:MAG: tRNA (N(6)-L-threonylcarbamoyladenosine(37)-C(2))-methylthiotransferase MtaB [Terriglobia bacterium]
MITFRMFNFGCRASQADGATLRAQLVEAGFAEADRNARSDLTILNTCTVTATADAEVRQVIRRIHREHPECRVLVTGCYAQRAPEELAALDGVAWVVGNSHKRLIPEILKRELASAGDDSAPARKRERSVWAGEISPEFHFLPASADDRTRPTLKVQDGCNARCSFCVIPSVRGRSRSLPVQEAAAQVRALAAKNYREVVLSGINLGTYGLDLQPRSTFFELLETLLRETSMARIRISSIEPMDVTADLIRLVATEPRLADHFHVPLQSGCDRILRQMNRRYWTSHYAERILAIREMMPHGGIGADVMVGFPGETDQDHSLSAQFIDSLPFTYLHIFPYSARPSTPAADRQDQVNGRIAHERGAELRRLITGKRRRFLEAQVGRTLPALTLNEPLPDGPVALCSNYLKVVLPGSGAPGNQLMDVRVQRVYGDGLAGHPDRLYYQLQA